VICAGQFAPWRWHNDKWEEAPVPHTLALGIFPQFKFSASEFPCLPGEKWLLFSDGINEGRSPTGEEFGVERLRSSLGTGSSAAVLAQAWRHWEDFVDSDRQHDDACLALILTKPVSTLEISSSARNCKLARQFIEQWAQTAGFPDLERGRIVLAVDEAVTNIMRHTYGGCEDRCIIVSASISDEYLRFHLRDYGPPVDPAVLKGRALEDIKPGGLGLHLLKSVFSQVEHQPLSDGNEWRLAKPLP
jgi:anti-sigma regulatory factor (Ser/Thr protein kinase)